MLSRTNLVDRLSSTSSISFTSFRLRTLFRSLRSFSRPDPLFSITSALFLQNTRGCGCLKNRPFRISDFPTLSLHSVAIVATEHPAKDANPERPSGVEGSQSAHSRHSPLATFPRPLFSCSYKSLVTASRFTSFLFSRTYKTLFPQLLSFHIHAKPPGGGGPSTFSTHSPPGRQRGDQGFATEGSFAA